MTTQLDLFGEVETAEERSLLAVLRARYGDPAVWEARFVRGVIRRGLGPEMVGWQCPDPYCLDVDPTPWGLAHGHGFHPLIPGHAPADGRCHAVRHMERCTHRLETVRPGPAGASRSPSSPRSTRTGSARSSTSTAPASPS